MYQLKKSLAAFAGLLALVSATALLTPIHSYGGEDRVSPANP